MPISLNAQCDFHGLSFDDLDLESIWFFFFYYLTAPKTLFSNRSASLDLKILEMALK